ncbi:MAG: winged helix-turn-helix transcriptional regulator [Candidatus Lokiarchaeota archaeon]|nr:winged helix-turn-helix transcriptional regulator [Candidatus Lokiarchaeota archaeon]
MNLFKILSDVNVLNIILKLKKGEKAFQELQKELELSQSNLSHLMKRLTDAKIISFRREERKKYYKIKNTNIFKILTETMAFLMEMQKETIEELKDFSLYDI